MTNKRAVMTPFYLNEQTLNTFQQLFEHGGVHFNEKPLAELDTESAHRIIDELYSPEERFAQGFFKYRVDVLKNPEQLAWQNTLEELEHYKKSLKANITDPCVYTVGTEVNTPKGERTYTPVGIYCMRNLAEHERGAELEDALNTLGLADDFAGHKMIVHSFSLLKDFRNLSMLKFIFIAIGLKAIKQQAEHIFFFMSDYRLKSIYTRYGLVFPADLKFRNSEHVIGCYSLTEANMLTLLQEIDRIAAAKHA